MIHCIVFSGDVFGKSLVHLVIIVLGHWLQIIIVGLCNVCRPIRWMLCWCQSPRWMDKWVYLLCFGWVLHISLFNSRISGLEKGTISRHKPYLIWWRCKDVEYLFNGGMWCHELIFSLIFFVIFFIARLLCNFYLSEGTRYMAIYSMCKFWFGIGWGSVYI